MYPFEQVPGEESINYHLPGGYHPVHLGDTFHNGTYQVVHKLGFGGYSTVWLVKDRKRGRYASMKILAAEASMSEVDVMRHVQRNGSALSGREFVVQLIDEFEHTGPNGVHRCIISEVLGPPVSSDIEDLYPSEEYPIGLAKRIVAQIARGLEYLHHCGVVHGDLHLKNILFHSPSITSWSSQEEVYQYLDPPRCKTISLRNSTDAVPSSPHVPAYIVQTPHPTSLLELCLSDPSRVHVKICDFSESFIYNPANNRKLHTPLVYAAPEILFNDVPSPASDVWAFAVLAHELVSGGVGLFPSYHGILNEILREMVLTLGKLPERWWLNWADQGQYFDDNGRWIADRKNLLKFSGQLVKVRPSRMNEQERVYFEKMIRTMVAYEPSERATMTEVVKLIPDTWLTSKVWVPLCTPRVVKITR